MLPDLVSIKTDIETWITAYLSAAIRARQGPFADSPRHVIHEGRELRMVRADDSVDESSLKEASVEWGVKYADIPVMTPESLRQRLDELADKMAAQIQAHLFETLNETLDKAGQALDAKGKPLTSEMFFELLEKMQIEFDDEGTPKDLKLVVGPALIPRIQQLQEEERRNPAIRKRHDEIIQKKWLEWRDREASRKLVG